MDFTSFRRRRRATILHDPKGEKRDAESSGHCCSMSRFLDVSDFCILTWCDLLSFLFPKAIQRHRRCLWHDNFDVVVEYPLLLN